MRAPLSSLLASAETGDGAAADELFTVLYAELHRLARRELARKGGRAALGTTSLLHEAYLDIAGREGPSFPDRSRFMAYAARAMRGLIIDFVRAGRALKRGGELTFVHLDAEHEQPEEPWNDARELEQISDALDALAAVDPALAEVVDLKFFCGLTPGGERFSVGELLEQGELLIDRQFETDEVLRAEMLVAIGQQYMISERWDRAQPALERAAELARRSTDPALRARALCHLAALIGATRSVAEAKSLIEEALAGLPGGALWDLQRAECTVGLANLGFFTDDSAPMIRNAELALDLFDRAPVVSATGRIDAHAALAYGYYLAHQNRRADREYELLLDELTRLGRERTLAAASLFNNWALVHYLGDLERAEPMTRRAVELRRAIEGASVGPTALFNHAGVLFQLGRWQEAEPLLEETIRTAAARRETRIELDATIELAGVYLETGRLDQAEQTLRLVEARSEDPRFHEWRRSHLAYYRGRLAQARGEHDAARERFAEAVEIYARRKSKIAMSVLALIGLAESDGALGRPTDAARAAGEALAVAEGFVEPEQPSYLVGLARLALGRAQLAQGERDAARQTLELASRHLAATLGEEHPATRAALAERER
ncbi:MAG TPA: ECF-type sigma factor [Thermoanaerobaculia bacterium]|nr:ECF-type sigma factor [Thermoanaerobaculia bacterium]